MSEMMKQDFLTPDNFEQAMKFASLMAKSELVPKDFRNKPENILVAIQWGAELGIKPMQAMQNIAVINGRPSLWGDAVLAIVQSHHAYEWIKETDDGVTATCTIKRKGEEPHTSTFSMDDAKKAGLTGKTGPWSQYPARMRKMRARGFALRDKFADALKGIGIAEEVMDMPKEVTVSQSHVIKDITSTLVAPNVTPVKLAEAQQEPVEHIEHEVPAPSLEVVLEAINSCETVSELEEIKAAGGMLTGEDKKAAIGAYKSKRQFILSQENGVNE